MISPTTVYSNFVQAKRPLFSIKNNCFIESYSSFLSCDHHVRIISTWAYTCKPNAFCIWAYIVSYYKTQNIKMKSDTMKAALIDKK